MQPFLSAFTGRGKKTAWMTWKSFADVTAAFGELLSMLSGVSNESMLAGAICSIKV